MFSLVQSDPCWTRLNNYLQASDFQFGFHHTCHDVKTPRLAILRGPHFHFPFLPPVCFWLVCLKVTVCLQRQLPRPDAVQMCLVRAGSNPRFTCGGRSSHPKFSVLFKDVWLFGLSCVWTCLLGLPSLFVGSLLEAFHCFGNGSKCKQSPPLGGSYQAERDSWTGPAAKQKRGWKDGIHLHRVRDIGISSLYSKPLRPASLELIEQTSSPLSVGFINERGPPLFLSLALFMSELPTLPLNHPV